MTSEFLNPAHYQELLEILAGQVHRDLVRQYPYELWQIRRQGLAYEDLTDWSSLGLPSDLNLRVALHTGPVYVGEMPLAKNFGRFPMYVLQTMEDPVDLGDPSDQDGCGGRS